MLLKLNPTQAPHCVHPAHHPNEVIGVMLSPGSHWAIKVPEKPIHGEWWNDGEPWTVMGDSQTWENYTVTVRAAVGGPAPP